MEEAFWMKIWKVDQKRIWEESEKNWKEATQGKVEHAAWDLVDGKPVANYSQEDIIRHYKNALDIRTRLKLFKLDRNHFLYKVISYNEDNPQYGAVARRDLKAGERLGYCTGDIVKLVDLRDSDGTYDYGIGYEDRVLSSLYRGNELRYINDPATVSYDPTTNKWSVVDPGSPNIDHKYVEVEGEVKVLYWVISDVKKGEELLMSYGNNYWV